MANPATRIADFNELAVSFGGIPIDGWADGDTLTITKDADAFGDTVGNAGDVARWKTNDNRADVEIRTLQSSPVNAALSAIYNADKNAPGGAGVGALIIADLNGTSLYSDGNAWIKRSPDPVYGREATDRTWIIRCPNLKEFTGGNL